MQQETFIKFKELFSERCNKISLVDIGEDSVRYDFFIALSETKKLLPSDIQLEYAIDRNSFIERKNEKSKRKEKPQIDLVVDTDIVKLNIEFGLFRQNSNDKSNIDKTARTVKMLNDMIRLCLDSFYTKRQSYFICVADDKILGHQLQSKIIGKFPSNYLITTETIKKQKEKKTSDFDERFISIFNKLNLTIDAKIIFNEEIIADKIERETRLIVWKILTN